MHESIDPVVQCLNSIGSDETVLVEAVGSPGSGKTFLSELLEEALDESARTCMHHRIDSYGSTRTLQFVKKSLLILPAIIRCPALVGLSIRPVRLFPTVNRFQKLRVAFNFLLILSIVRSNLGKSSTFLFDQGLMQCFWSCCFRQCGNISATQREMLAEYVETVRNFLSINRIVVVFVSADLSNVGERLINREVRGSSTVDGSDFRSLVESESVSNSLRDILISKSKQLPALSIIDIPN